MDNKKYRALQIPGWRLARQSKSEFCTEITSIPHWKAKTQMKNSTGNKYVSFKILDVKPAMRIEPAWKRGAREAAARFTPRK